MATVDKNKQEMIYRTMWNPRRFEIEAVLILDL